MTPRQREVLERELSLCRDRLKVLPQERKRLVEGYRRGLYADFMMREEMEQIVKEQAELERQLAQRQLTATQEAQVKSLVKRIGIGLDSLDFPGRQELLRLLVEKVCYDGSTIEIQTIIPLGEQLHPIHRGG